MKSKMPDAVSSPPVRAKIEPTDSLSPKPSVDHHRRSRTGCRTCRRRKKKCDEERPGCRNCAKNNILCDGYEIKKPWRKGSRNRASVSVPELPHIISAVDDPLDSHLLSYFITHSNQILSIYPHGKNPFQGLVVEAAIGNAGLMHSLLCLSASCLIAHQPTSAHDIVVRQSHHFDRAVVTLRQAVEAFASDRVTGSTNCIMLQTILLGLEAIVTGTTQGTYRCHLLAAQRLFESSRDLSCGVRDFARQFLLYYNLANAVSCLHPVNDLQSFLQENRCRSSGPQSSPGSASDIVHGLLDPISSTRQVRDGIRFHRTTGDIRWYTDEKLLGMALDVETQLRAWKSRLPSDTAQYWASLAYRQSAYVYLYRTMKPSMGSPELAQVVSEGLLYTSLALQEATSSNNWVCGMLLPPLFLLGCGAFEPSQRLSVVRDLDNLRTCNQGTNTTQARAILEEVWSRMDTEHGAERAWDWEAVMKDMDMDVMLS